MAEITPGTTSEVKRLDFDDNGNPLSSMFQLKLPFLDMPLTTAGLLYEKDRPWQFMRIIHIDHDQTETLNAEYTKTSIPGRNIPVVAFAGLSNRSISLTLHFHATVFPLLEVQRKISWLKSMEYPRDQVDRTIPPAKMVLALGAYLMIRGVITSVSATHKPPYSGLNIKDAGMIAMLPQYAVVDVTMEETENFFTGDLPDHQTAETERDFGANLLGLPVAAGALAFAMNLY